LFDLTRSKSMAARCGRRIQRVIATGMKDSFRASCTDAAGKQRILECSLCPVRHNSDQTEAIVLLTRDVTVRRRVARALRCRSKQFRNLLDQTPSGVFLLDARLRIQEANPLARTFFGDLPDLIGRDFSEAARRLWPRFNSEKLTERLRHTLLTGEASLMPHLEDNSLRQTVGFHYAGMNYRIASRDGSPGVICFLRTQQAAIIP
jgi:PAS domain-containing protein